MRNTLDQALAVPTFQKFEIITQPEGHLEEMALLTTRAYHKGWLPIPTSLVPESEHLTKLTERQNYKGFWSFLAFDGDRLAGFTAGYQGNWKNEISDNNSDYLWLLMIDPDYQRKGLGRALLQLAEASALEDGANSLILYTSIQNLGAIGLYKSEGFVHTQTVHSDQDGFLAQYRLDFQQS